MTSDRIKHLQALEEAATKGPWVQGNAGNGQITVHDMTYLNRHISYLPMDAMPDEEQEANAAFIAASRNCMKELLALVVEMEKSITDVSNECMLSSFAAAGDPTKQDEMKMCAMWAARLQQALSQLKAFRDGVENV